MTAEPSEGQVTEGFRSLEVRWIFPGRLETAVAGWFGRFPIEIESREDTYLLAPRLHGLSVKVRGGRSLEVKVYRGGAGILDVAGRARGRMESWQKWSFPGSPLDQYSGDPAGWRPVRKRRRISRFSFASGQIVAGAPGLDQEPRCDVELTEVSTRGQAWWTLGSAAHSRAPPGSCSPTPCPVRNPASMNPGPTCSGCSRRARARTRPLLTAPGASPTRGVRRSSDDLDLDEWELVEEGRSSSPIPDDFDLDSHAIGHGPVTLAVPTDNHVKKILDTRTARAGERSSTIQHSGCHRSEPDG